MALSRGGEGLTGSGLVNENMAIRDRQRMILEHVNQVGVASVHGLALRFGVSEMTIRRDVVHLARSNLLTKVKGGAQRLDELGRFHEAHLRARMGVRVEAKRRLAEEAATLVEPGDTLFLDGSTTIVSLARVLAAANPAITVVTNSALVALELADAQCVRLICLGGLFDHETFCFCPTSGEEEPLPYHVRKAFLSCTGFVVTEGTFENSVFNMAMKRKVVRSAETVHVLVDASKLDRRALNRVVGIDEIDVVVTEVGLSEAHAKALSSQRIQVVLA